MQPWFMNPVTLPNGNYGSGAPPQPGYSVVNPANYPTNPDIPSCICPSAPPRSGNITNLVTIDYSSPACAAGQSGVIFAAFPGATCLGVTNYLPVAGYSGSPDSGFLGLLGYGTVNSLARVPDGTSNTLLFGEYSGGFNPFYDGKTGSAYLDYPGWTGASFACGAGYTGFGLSSSNLAANGVTYPSSYAQFGSFHNQGTIINFAFADGSVRHILSTVDFSTFVYLGGFQDGVVITWDSTNGG
jgi:prepilin-type processing-associated H-X9-DG protein